MKVNYFDLISPYGVTLNGVGRIHSPSLKSVCLLGHDRYSYLISMLAMSMRDYIGMIAKMSNIDTNPYDEMPDEVKNQMNMFELLTSSAQGIEDMGQAIAMFIDGEIVWDQSSGSFLVNPEISDGTRLVDGSINKDNYLEVSDICLQMVCVQAEKQETLKFKNERSRKFYERFQKKKEAAKQTKKRDPKYELSNIISAVATFHNSLNMTNIWDMTVYQVHDTFFRQQIKNQVLIRDHNYAVWGGDYKPEFWLERIDNQQ